MDSLPRVVDRPGPCEPAVRGRHEGPYRTVEGLTSTAWAPAVDIYETDKEIVLKAELTEMQEKDIDIKVEDNVLSIAGERRMEKEVKEEN